MQTKNKLPDVVLREADNTGSEVTFGLAGRPKEGRTKSQLLVGAEFSATMVIDALTGSAAPPAELMKELRIQAEQVNSGDLRAVEAMLVNQAVSLQTIYADLAVRAKKEETWTGIQTLMQLALRAQSNSRATLQALAEMKSPKQIAFVRQANVAQTQQVNNGVGSGEDSRPSRKKKDSIRAKQTISGGA